MTASCGDLISVARHQFAIFMSDQPERESETDEVRYSTEGARTSGLPIHGFFQTNGNVTCICLEVVGFCLASKLRTGVRFESFAVCASAQYLIRICAGLHHVQTRERTSNFSDSWTESAWPEAVNVPGGCGVILVSSVDKFNSQLNNGVMEVSWSDPSQLRILSFADLWPFAHQQN